MAATDLADSIDEALWFGTDDEEGSDDQAKASVAAEVARVSGLKPFPVVAARVLHELSQDDYSVPRVTNLMESDPALASLVLRMVNSAAYGRGTRFNSVDHAVVRLGARRVRDLVAAAATMQMFHDVRGIGVTFRDHCSATAAVVRILGQNYELPGGSSLFLAGLLHDVGKLLLMETREFDYTTLSPQVIARPDSVHTLERAQLSYDHAVLGANVLKAWTIPDPIPQIVAWHHQPNRAFQAGGDIGVQVSLLRLADNIAWYLAQTSMPSAKFNDFLANTPEANWVGLTESDLDRMWVSMVEARGEAMQIFS